MSEDLQNNNGEDNTAVADFQIINAVQIDHDTMEVEGVLGSGTHSEDEIDNLDFAYREHPAVASRNMTSARIAVEYSIDDSDFFRDGEVPSHYVGRMDQVCEFCNARFWNTERTAAGKYTACCSQGKVQLPKIAPPPAYIKQLLLGVSPEAKLFYRKSVAFNTSVSFASISMNQQQFPATRGVPALRISGSVYHNIGSIHPDANTQAKFM